MDKKDDIELYDSNGNHVGYGVANEYGGYEIFDDSNNWVGNTDPKGIAGSHEVYDFENNHQGYIDDPSLGFTTIHKKEPQQTYYSTYSNKTYNRFVNKFYFICAILTALCFTIIALHEHEIKYIRVILFFVAIAVYNRIKIGRK